MAKANEACLNVLSVVHLLPLLASRDTAVHARVVLLALAAALGLESQCWTTEVNVVRPHVHTHTEDIIFRG